MTETARRVLVAEDDADIAELVAHHLERAGYLTDVVASGGDVLPRAREQRPDLVVLDLMLPVMSGLDICRAMRRESGLHDVPIIMLTARSEESDRIVGLELGADDYVTKPFSPKELVARVGAVIRRTGRRPGDATPSCASGRCVVDGDKHRRLASRGGTSR